VGAIIATLIRLVGAKSPISKMIGEFQNSVITEERVDAAVENLLARGKAPTPFIDWVGDVVGRLYVSINQWPLLDRSQKIGIIASLFSEQSASFVQKVLPGIPKDVAAQPAARREIAKRVLYSQSLEELEVAENVKS
jgi:hypothetical protein